SMLPRRILAAGLVLLPLAASGLGTYALYQQPAEVHVDFEHGFESGFISGFHPRERTGGKSFRWTTGESYIDVENLPPTAKLEVEAHLKVIRPAGEKLPLLWFTANGVTVHRALSFPGVGIHRFSLPLRSPSLRLGIHSETFTAGGGRNLGVQVLSVHLRAQEGQGRPALMRPLGWMVLSAGLLLAAGWIAGLRLSLSSLAATFFSAGFVFLLAQSSVRFMAYPQQVAFLSSVTLVASGLLRGAFSRMGWLNPEERRSVAPVISASLLLKLAALFYPLLVISDASFHANRLGELLQGNLFLTSVSQHQPPFRIPYPVSLYVLAAPWVAGGLDRVAALKLVTAFADVGAGLMLVYLARRFLRDLRAGIFAAALYQLVPLNFLAFSSGNFTNLFGVSTAILFLGFLLAVARGGGAILAALAFLFSLLSLTAHFSTFLMGIPLWPATLTVLLWLPPREASSRRSRLLVTAVAGSLALAGLYYAGYLDLFTSQWQRVVTGEQATGQAEVAGPLAKLAFNLPFYREQLGSLFGLLVLLGAVRILWKARASPFHATAAVWMGVTALFFLLDLTTALEVRYLLQALPLLSVLAGSYVSGAWERKGMGRFAAVAALGYLTAVGFANVHHCLLYRYH
ncbi:MAG: hypothetical protein ACE5JI_04220, partial [Acidobacteriota bacterium]